MTRSDAVDGTGTAGADPGGDRAHFVSDLVETGALDLSAIYASYEESAAIRRMTRG
jgi:hypothetical protein